MQLTTDAICQAWQMHARVYARERGWEIDDHIKCWRWAHRAFERASRADFADLYDHLRRYWLVFRGSKHTPWTPDQTFNHLAGLDQRYHTLRLSQLASGGDLEGCWTVIRSMSGIKPTKSPSVVAISKFLHFWNPRLFVIVDDAVM